VHSIAHWITADNSQRIPNPGVARSSRARGANHCRLPTAEPKVGAPGFVHFARYLNFLRCSSTAACTPMQHNERANKLFRMSFMMRPAVHCSELPTGHH
jgi:hypothetical protein